MVFSIRSSYLPALFIFFASLSLTSWSQTLSVDSEGRQIIVYPDGSWRFFADPPDSTDAASSASATLPDNTSVESFFTTPELEAQARAIVRKLAEDQTKEASKFRELSLKATQKEEKLHKQATKLKASTKFSAREELEIVSRKMQETRKERELADQQAAITEKRAEILMNSIRMTRAQRRDYFTAASLEDFFGEDRGIVMGLAPTEEKPNPPRPDEAEMPTLASNPFYEAEQAANIKAEQALAETRNSGAFVAYNEDFDPRINPPQQPCKIASRGLDEFTQKMRIALEPELFFTFTTEELKPYLGDLSLITCVGQLKSSGGSTVLELNFIIRSQFANKEFSSIPRGSQLTLLGINGERVMLRNQQAASGEFDAINKYYTFKGIYPLTGRQVRSLSKMYLDEVRVMWGTGFEDYKIYDADYLKRQLKCL